MLLLAHQTMGWPEAFMAVGFMAGVVAIIWLLLRHLP